MGAPAAVQAAAQDGDSIVIGERPQLDTVQIDDFRLALDFLFVDEDDERETGGETLRDTDQTFREILELATSGYFGHPNLVSFDMTGRFGLEQEEIESDTFGQRDRTSQSLLEYNLLFDILREAELPLTLYAQQDQVLLTRQFGPSLDSVSSEYGGILHVRSETAPMRVQVFHREQDQSSAFDDLDFSLAQNTVAASGQVNFAPAHFMTWDYTFDDVVESGSLRPTTSFQRHDAYINDSYSFGDIDEHNLRSAVQVLSQSGDFPIDRLRWTEALLLLHSQDLETRYDYTFDRQDVEGSTQTFQLGTARLRHHLFESLISNVEMGGSKLDVSETGFTSEQIFGSLGFEYTKRVPYGQLTATANVGHTLQENSEQGGSLTIVDEVHTFGVSGLIFLERRFIEPASIVITSADGFTIFREGVDYTVMAFDDHVEIRRVLGGDISDGQTVLIDYRVGPEPGGTTNTTRTGGTIRYRIDEGALTGVSVYGRFFEQDEDRSTTDFIGIPESDFQDLVFGAEYELRELLLKSEYQIRTGSFSPFEALRIEAYYTYPLGLGSSLVFTALHHEIDRTNEDIQTSINTISGVWNQQIDTRLKARLLLLWREEDDSAGVDVTGFEQQLDLTWDYKQTTVYGSLRNAFIESDVTDSTFQTIILGIRREF